jgi:hypothetical protein
MYATPTKSIEFRKDTIGMSNDGGFYGKGFYFTFNTDPRWKKMAEGEASYYGKNVREYFINSKKESLFNSKIIKFTSFYHYPTPILSMSGLDKFQWIIMISKKLVN